MQPLLRFRTRAHSIGRYRCKRRYYSNINDISLVTYTQRSHALKLLCRNRCYLRVYFGQPPDEMVFY